MYRIEEFGVSCFLILGKERALLIDTCNGLGNLRAVIESITSLPVTVAVTHGHTDHIGGATWYEQVYVHKDDISFTAKITGSRFAGKRLVFANPLSKELGITKNVFLKKKYKPKKLVLEDGHVFDLGDRIVRVVHTPGHTKGSIIFLDENSKTMFTGDNTSPALWMFLPGAVKLEAWLPGAHKILELTKTYPTCYTSHLPMVQPVEQIERLVQMVTDIVDAQPKNKFFGKLKIYPSKDDIMKEGAVTVWYRTGRVRN